MVGCLTGPRDIRLLGLGLEMQMRLEPRSSFIILGAGAGAGGDLAVASHSVPVINNN